MENFFIFCFLKQKISLTHMLRVGSFQLDLVWTNLGSLLPFLTHVCVQTNMQPENMFTTIVSWRGHDDKWYIFDVCIKVMCNYVTLARPRMIRVTCVGLGFVPQKPILPPPRKEHIYFWGCFYTTISLNVINGSQPLLGYLKMSIDYMVCNSSKCELQRISRAPFRVLGLQGS